MITEFRIKYVPDLIEHQPFSLIVSSDGAIKTMRSLSYKELTQLALEIAAADDAHSKRTGQQSKLIEEVQSISDMLKIL